MTTTYTINMVDRDEPAAWLRDCLSVTPGAQDSGRVRVTVTTREPAALEAALEADADVISYSTRVSMDETLRRMRANA